MTNDIVLKDYLDFISSLLAAIFKASLYPAQHPILISAVKDAYSTLQQILSIKNTVSLNLFENNKILIDSQSIPVQSTESVKHLVSYLKALDIESLVFNSGVTEKELRDFVTVILLTPAQIKKYGGINKIFLDKGIQHIKTDLFSYKRIKKGQEMLAVDEKTPILDILKSKVRECRQGKIKSPQEIEEIEKKLFELMSAELKEKKKIGFPLKDIYKRFLLCVSDRASALLKLKNTLLEAGCSSQDVDNLVNKIQEKIQKQGVELGAVKQEEIENLRKENEKLRLDLEILKQDINKNDASLKELASKNERLLEAKERIDSIVRHMSDGLIVIGPDGKILMANSTAEALLGITSKDIGKSIKEVIRDEHLLTLVKSLSVNKEGVVEQDIELFSQNESTKRVLKTSSAVVEDHNGHTLGMVAILNDITRQKEIEKLKSDFVANVTHELRTPLIAIEKSISLLVSKTAGPISQDQEQFLSIAERNLKRLTLLINDLLDLSKIEAGKMELKREPISIEKIINESIESFAAWAKTKSIKIEKIIQDGTLEVNVDRDRINQVLVNLIGNAIKFTPPNGKITVEAILRKENEEIEVSVQDTGIGISKEELPKIFDKFYQSARGASHEISGTGIGLSIAKEIIELHGGKIWAESDEGQGAKFIFTLPLKNKSKNSEK